MIRSKIISLSNNIYLYSIFIIIVLFSFTNIYLIILVPIYLFLARKRIKIKKFLLIIFIFLILVLIIYLIKKINFFNNIGVIVEKKEDKYIIVSNFKKYDIYLKNSFNLNIGNIIRFEGKYLNYDKEIYLNSFNIYKNKLGNNIYGYININKIEIISDGFNYKYLSKFLYNYFSSFSGLTKKYLLSIFFNEHEIDSNYLLFKNFNLSFLLSLSGIHLLAIKKIVNFFYYNFNFNDKNKEKIILSSYFLLGIFTNFGFVLVRYILMNILKIFNKKYELTFSNLDIISLSSLFLLLFNFNYIYNLGFIITYLVLYFLELTNYLFYYKNSFYLFFGKNLLIYLILFPFIINNTNKINLSIFIIAPLVIFHFRKIQIYMFFLIIIVKPLELVNNYLLDSLIYFLEIVDKYSISIKIASLSNFLIFIYYILLIIFLVSSRKKKIIFYLFILFLIFKNNINFYSKIIILNDKNNDSILIQHSQNILIDLNKHTKNYFIKNKITKIKYLIITKKTKDLNLHFENLKEKIDIENIILNMKYNFNLKHHNITYSYDEIVLNNLKISFLENEKSMSLPILINLRNKKIFILNDIIYEDQIYLNNKYLNLLKADIIKLNNTVDKIYIPFIDLIKPKNIIVNDNNIFKNNYKNKLIFNRLGYSLEIKLIFNKIYFKSYENKHFFYYII